MNTSRSVRWVKRATIFVGCSMAIYHLVSSQVLLHGIYEHQDVHLGLGLALVFLDGMTRRNKVSLLSVLLLATALIVTGYIYFSTDYLDYWVGRIPTPTVWVIGILLVVVVLEGTRQAWGSILPIVCLCFIAYFFFGNLLPSPLRHSPFQPEYIVSMLGIGFHGIFR